MGLVGGRRFALFFLRNNYQRNDMQRALRVSAGLRSSVELRVLFVKSVHCFPPTSPTLSKIA